MSAFSNANPFGFEEKKELGSWITWLSEPLAEAGACLLPLHQQSRLVVPKDDDAGALGDWATKHAALVEEIAGNLKPVVARSRSRSRSQ